MPGDLGGSGGLLSIPTVLSASTMANYHLTSVVGTSHLGLKLVTSEIRYIVPCDMAVWLGGHRWKARCYCQGPSG